MRIAVELGRKLRTRHGNQGIARELELRTEENRFQAGRAFLVTDEKVRAHQGETVHGTGHGNAEMVVAGPAEILNRGREARMRHLDRHCKASSSLAL